MVVSVRLEDLFVSSRIVSVETGKILKSATYDYKGEIDELLTTGMRMVAYELIEWKNSIHYNLYYLQKREFYDRGTEKEKLKEEKSYESRKVFHSITD